MRRFWRRLDSGLDTLLSPRDPFDGWGWHVDARDWPAGDCGMTPDEVCAALDGITPEIAAAAQASLLAAGTGGGRDA